MKRTEAKNRVHSDCMKIVQGVLPEIKYENMAFGIVQDVMDGLGYTQNTIDTNGYEVDYWSDFNKPNNPSIRVSGSMYNGYCTITLRNNENRN